MAKGITVEFNANMVKFAEKLDQIQGKISTFEQKTERTAATINKAFGALGLTLSVASFGAFIKGGIDAMDMLGKLSDRTGIAVSDLAGLKLAADLNDTSLEGVAKAANKLSNAIAINGDAFKQLGIDAKDPLESLLQYADVFSGISDEQQRAAFGMKTLGEEYAALAPLLRQGSGALREQIQLGRELRPVTDEMARSSAAFNDEITKLTANLDTLRINLAGPIVKSINEYARAIQFANNVTENFDLLRWIRDFSQTASGDPLLQLDALTKDIGQTERKISELERRYKIYAEKPAELGILKAELTRLKAARDTVLNEIFPPKPKAGGGIDVSGFLKTAPSASAGRAGVSDSDREAQRLRGQGEALAASLQRQVALYGETSIAAQTRYDLELGSLAALDPAHKSLIQNYADQLSALDRQQAQWDELVRSANELVDLKDEINQLEFDVIDERQFIAGIARIQDAFKNDLIDEAEMKAMFDRIGESFNESFIVNAMDGVTEINQFAVQSARNMQNAFADFFFDPFSEGLDGMAKGFVDTIRRMAANLAAESLLTAFVGNLGQGGELGGIIGSLFHSGGVVGQTGGASRSVPAMAFAGAGRFHSGGFPGLQRDEVPAILQKGELVLSRNQVANMGSDSGGISITTNVSVSGGSGGAENARALGERINAQIRKVMVDEKRPGGLLA